MSQMNVQSALRAAIAHHQAGRLQEAEALYRQILGRFPQHPDALHMLGVLAHHAGHSAVAVDLINQAIRLTPKHAPCYCNLGNALQAQGLLDEAIRSYRRALALKPSFADAHLNLGNALRAKGLPDEAVQSYRRAAAIQPDYAEAHYNLGNTLQAQGRLDDAVASLRQAIAIRPAYAEAHNNLGNALQANRQLDDAIASYRQALVAKPDYVEAHNNLGLALQAQGRTDEAIASIERALAIRPDYAEAHSNLGSQFEVQGRLDAALACYQRALALKPDFAEAHNNLGNVLQAEGRLEDAVDSYRRALALRPGYADALTNLGNALQAQGLLDEAIATCDRSLALQPDCADAHWNKAFALLLKGDFAAGWAQFEWRWQALEQHGAARRFAQPPWLGDAPVGTCTLLLHHEQGLGDTLQMLRYAPVLAAQGARVLVEVPAALAAIAASADGVAAVIVQGTELPPFDLHCPFMSLPLAAQTTLASVPADVPYLFAPDSGRREWQDRLGPPGRRRIGLAWSGSTTHKNDRQRSIPLRLLQPLLALDAGFHSLQKEYRSGDAALMATAQGIRDHAEQLGDFADTAGLIEQLDLVITVDTAVAHLAGAMGKPVWLLLPFAPDYRWLLGRSDSPWYPTMRLFRQPVSNDWTSVIRDVCAALADLGPQQAGG